VLTILKHTFGHRLEAAGVSDRDCQVLLGHARMGVTRQYMAPEVARLLQAAESVLNTERHGTIPLTIIRRKVAEKPVISKVAQPKKWPGKPER
jgi:hypothetical protein